MVRVEHLQTQTQILAPQLRQSLKILQASALDLGKLIQEEMAMNPTLEEVPEAAKPDMDPMDGATLSATTSGIDQAAASKQHDFMMESISADVSLQEHLQWQVGCLELAPKMRQVVQFIIGSLNEKGFLELPIEGIQRQTGSDYKTVTQALKVVQQLDPVGVGCKDIASSLMVQLKHKKKEHSLAFQILSQCYDLLLRNKLVEIARVFSVTVEAVQKAIREDIATLNPSPASAYAVKPAQAIIPDVRIYKNDLGQWMIEMNRKNCPQLRISDTYKTMLGHSINREDRAYLRLKMRSGRFFIQAILQRQKTIEQISRALLQQQMDFFEKGKGYLKPLTLQMIAETLGVHETTVSRATANKYVDTPFGVFSFSYFFTKGLPMHSGGLISNAIVKQQIQKLVAEEDKSKPLSDQKIVALLAKQQIKVARRTVAKYRDRLGILAANLRRSF